ncbi:MAG TPA: biopolymer transporter ExbD [Pyrinomonadaceae bacterium]
MGMSSGGSGRAVPYINVTPLIDVLLVLLIIFMVVTPLKPKRFMTQIPEPPPPGAPPDAAPVLDTMKVKIYGDRPTRPEDQAKRNMVEFIHAKGDALGGDLVGTFNEDGQYTGGQALATMVKNEFNNPQRAEDKRTVYIQAPKSFPYGKIVQVIDTIKAGGTLWCAEKGKKTADPDKPSANDCPQVPVGLQIDYLDPQ